MENKCIFLIFSTKKYENLYMRNECIFFNESSYISSVGRCAIDDSATTYWYFVLEEPIWYKI